LNYLGINRLGTLRAVVALFALVVCMAIPSVASAQDPAGDQYAPTTPDGGGSVPGNGNSNPDPQSAPGGHHAAGNLGASYTGAGNGSGAGDSGGPIDVNPAPSAASSTEGSSGITAAKGNDSGENKAQRTLDKIGAAAEQKRLDAARAANGSAAPGSDLLRSESDSGSGMGIVLWIVLGGTLLWALASAVARYRARPGGKQSERNGKGQLA
jgi:hypothetical protein